MEYLSLRFSGNGVSPGNTRCRDVADLIRAAEDLVESLLAEDDNEDVSALTLSLVAIEDQSLGLKFSAAAMTMVLTAWQTLAIAVNSGKIDRLPEKTRASLTDIVHFVKKRNCTGELGDSSHPDSVLATITPDTELPSSSKMSGNTSIIGKVVRVGGSDPKVGLKLSNGRTLSCDTSEMLAKEMGHRLYEVVVCKGEATWNLGDNSLLKFKVKDIAPFHRKPASEAFAELAAVMPKTLARWRQEEVSFASE